MALEPSSLEWMQTLVRGEADTVALIDTLTCAILVTDCAGQIMLANPAAAGLLGISQAKLRNQLLLHFTEDRAAFMSMIRGLPRDGRPLHGEARIRPRDRAPFIAAITVIADPRSDGQQWLWLLERISEARMRAGILPRAGAERAPSGPCET